MPEPAEQLWIESDFDDESHQDRLEAIKARLFASTPGTWTASYDSCDCSDGMCNHGSWVHAIVMESERPNCAPIRGEHTHSEYCRWRSELADFIIPDAELIAHAPADLRWLIARVAQLEAAQGCLDQENDQL